MATSTALSLVDVVNALQTLSVEQTTAISLQLGVELYTLDDIESRYRGNPSSVKSHSLQAWLNKDTEACWEKVVSGLQQLGMNAVAKCVATTYCPKAGAPDSTSSATGHAVQPVHQPVEATGSEVTPSSVTTTDSAQHPSLQVCTTHPPSCDNDTVAAVKAAIARLEERFSDVMSDTRSAMCDRELQQSKFLGKFRDVLLVLPVAKKATHVKFFRESEDEILDARNMRKLFVILSRYWSYTNYEILLQIVNRFCDATLKKSMQEYCNMLENFEVATTIDVYIGAISASDDLSLAFSQMVLKINKPPSVCTLHEVRKLTEALAEKASLHSYSVYIGSIRQSSVMLVLRFPPSAVGWVLAALTPDFLRTHLLAEVTVDGQPLTAIEGDRDDLVCVHQTYIVLHVHYYRLCVCSET